MEKCAKVILKVIFKKGNITMLFFDKHLNLYALYNR